jgi:hypothetical protein
MRSFEEIRFRLRQEVMNAALRVRPPKPRLSAKPRPEALPDASSVAQRLKGTPYAAGLERLGEQILEHRFPLLGVEIVTGPAIRWRRDYINGIETPAHYFRRVPYLNRDLAGDHKNVWELNRHQHLVLLAQAWILTGRREFIDVIERHIPEWLAQNPFQCGINWASALEVAFRALSWMWVLHIAGPQLTAELRQRMLTELYRHGLHLEYNLSVYFSRNTHLLGEAVALHAVGRLFPQFPRSTVWEKLGAETVRRELDYQVLADGAHFENSSYYHVYALDFFLLHYILAGRPRDYEPVLGRMADYLDALLGPTREIPLIGDDDGGRLFHPYGRHTEYGRATIATASVLLGRNGWYFDADDLHGQCTWWTGVVEAPKPPRRPLTSRLFSSCGIAVCSAPGVQVIVDAGTFGAGRGGHSHSDTLQIVVRRGGEELLVDPGTYTYVGDPMWRNWFRGSAAHNTIRIDGRDQAMPRGPFGWQSKPSVRVLDWDTSATADYIDAECRYDSFTHRRRVLYVKPHLIYVLDTIASSDSNPHTVEQFWHSAARCEPLSPHAYEIGAAAVLAFDRQYPAAVQAGWRSTAFATKEPAPVVCVTAANVALPIHMAAVVDLHSSYPPVEVVLEAAVGAIRIHRGGEAAVFPDASGSPSTRYPNVRSRYGIAHTIRGGLL